MLKTGICISILRIYAPASDYLKMPWVCPGVYPTSNMSTRDRNKQIFLQTRVPPVSEADNHTAICELII
jgi:hypothetical protein